VKGFKKYCMSTTVNETGDMLWNGSEEDGDVRCECAKDDCTYCEVGDSDSDW